MSVYSLLSVSVLLWFVTLSVSEKCDGYRGAPGVPGIPGTPGSNGMNGPKGQKGDPGEDTKPVRGANGEHGLPGRPGRPGLKGDEGKPGAPGPSGPKGDFQISSHVNTVFFSNRRRPTGRSVIAPNKIISFEESVSSDEAGIGLKNGLFTATQSGIYYFVYHVSAFQTACLCIKKRETVVLNMCDYSQGVLLTSGSVVLDLKLQDTVGLYVCSKTSEIFSTDADSTFTGFLLFSF